MDVGREQAAEDGVRNSRNQTWFRNEVRKALVEAERNDRMPLSHAEVLRTARARFGFELPD
ncbi:hypothetical protein [Chthonobacter albigriseus]|uniref:hypothetical protein n=1 Tax=Chthonobacter albigriseus TaxID=1683161 RepID=UPI0015EED7C2|nr:hypothetical protein [Chthonobacter albigriseus]